MTLFNETMKIKYGKYLMYLYFIEGLICKSIYRDTPGLWLIHMYATVIFICALIFIGGKQVIDFNYRNNRIQIEFLCIYLLWSLISSVFSISPFSNVIYSLISFFSIYVCVHLVAYLFHDDPTSFVLGIIKIYLIWLLLGILLSILIPDLNGSYGGYIRYRGASANATESGIILSIGFLLIIWYIKTVNSSKLLVLCLILTIICIILTRKRGALLGIIVALPLILCLKPKGALNKYKNSVIYFLISIVILSPFLIMNILKSDAARIYLRITEDDDTRSVYFTQAFEKIQRRPFLGYGPLSKFGSPRNITESDYDIDSDPHNTWLCLAQYYGLPSIAIFFMYLLSLICPFINSTANIYRPMILSFIVWGLVWAMICEWLMSFGTPGDRLSFMILGIGLASVNHRYFPNNKRSSYMHITG
jgi:O-antigen ligase